MPITLTDRCIQHEAVKQSAHLLKRRAAYVHNFAIDFIQQRPRHSSMACSLCKLLVSSSLSLVNSKRGRFGLLKILNPSKEKQFWDLS